MKAKEPTPDIYKVIYKLARWKTRSERYYTAFNTQQAFDDFHYAFIAGHVNSSNVSIHKIYRYDRFADRWYDLTKEVETLPDNCCWNKKNHIILTR